MLDVKADFEENIAGKIAANPEGAKLVDAIFTFIIVGDGGGTWTLNLKDDPGVTTGDAGNAECTVECDIEDWRAMRDDGSIAMRLFMEGKLKLTGNVMLATKLQQVLAGPKPKEGEDDADAPAKADGDAGAESEEPKGEDAGSEEPKSEEPESEEPEGEKPKSD